MTMELQGWVLKAGNAKVISNLKEPQATEKAGLFKTK